MGNGAWDASVHTMRSAHKAATNTATFDHTDAIQRGRVQASAHELLDPLHKAGPTSPNAGKVIREVCFSDEHPNPTPIAVAFDETGSMRQVPIALQKKLAELNGLLQRKGYVEDPQILFGAIGDANSDAAPLQVGQFESDNRMDETLEKIYLEGNGGGQGMETYDLFLYYMARHTYLEPLERDGKKGYLFTMGDERPYEVIKRRWGRHTLESLTGDALEADTPLQTIVDEVTAKFEWFHFVIPTGYNVNHSLPTWRKYLGERAVVLDDPNAVAETIALTIGLLEGAVALDDGMDDLRDAGMDPSAVQAAGKALAKVGANASGSAIAVATGGELDLAGDASGSVRL